MGHSYFLWGYVLFSVTVTTSVLAGSSASDSRISQQPLRDFQVFQPPVVPPTGAVSVCNVLLVNHHFSNSYGQPAMVNYTPPSNCGSPGTWSSIVLNYTGTSNGTQYDRLSTVILSGVEVLRTSTPEPTPLGIIWTQLKDVSRYSPVFARSGPLVLDLGNLLSSTLTGEYDIILSATFYASSKLYPAASAADMILPLSGMTNGYASVFSVPTYSSSMLHFPRNAASAFVEIYASGNGNEEFWYGNVPDQFYPDLPPWSAPDGYATDKGPFREVQLLIDGTLAGVAFPYPVIYTGEFLPSLWRPMMSYGAGDSPTYYVDISPFLGTLTDDLPHNFSLGVSGMGANYGINDNWFVSGNIQILLDSSSIRTTGHITSYEAIPFVTPNVSGVVEGFGPNVRVKTSATRELAISSVIQTGSGATKNVNWRQSMKFLNTEVYTNNSVSISTQTVVQQASGSSLSTHNSIPMLVDDFAYPFSLTLDYQVFPSTTANQIFYNYNVSLQHSYEREWEVRTGGAGNNIRTRQECSGTQSKHQPNVTLRTGKAEEKFYFADAHGHTYSRDVGVSTWTNTTVGLTTATESSVEYDRESRDAVYV